MSTKILDIRSTTAPARHRNRSAGPPPVMRFPIASAASRSRGECRCSQSTRPAQHSREAKAHTPGRAPDASFRHSVPLEHVASNTKSGCRERAGHHQVMRPNWPQVGRFAPRVRELSNIGPANRPATRCEPLDSPTLTVRSRRPLTGFHTPVPLPAGPHGPLRRTSPSFGVNFYSNSTSRVLYDLVTVPDHLVSRRSTTGLDPCMANPPSGPVCERGRAVLTSPVHCLLRTTNVPRERPLIRRLRCGSSPVPWLRSRRKCRHQGPGCYDARGPLVCWIG